MSPLDRTTFLSKLRTSKYGKGCYFLLSDIPEHARNHQSALCPMLNGRPTHRPREVGPLRFFEGHSAPLFFLDVENKRLA